MLNIGGSSMSQNGLFFINNLGEIISNSANIMNYDLQTSSFRRIYEISNAEFDSGHVFPQLDPATLTNFINSDASTVATRSQVSPNIMVTIEKMDLPEMPYYLLVIVTDDNDFPVQAQQQLAVELITILYVIAVLILWNLYFSFSFDVTSIWQAGGKDGRTNANENGNGNGENK